MRFVFLAAVLFFGAGNIFAGEGTTAASFLEIDGGARSAAMASAYTAVSGDGFSLHNNPAGLAFIDIKEFKISRLSWLEQIKLNTFSYAHPFGKDWTIALGGNYLTSGDMEKRDALGNLTGSYSYYGLVMGLAVARRLNENISAGLGAKFIKEALEDEGATAQALDAGLLYKLEKFSAGFAVRNFGTKSKLYQESFSLPSEIRAGVGLSPVENLIISADFHKVKNSKEQFSFGTEYGIKGNEVCDWFFIRAGYKANPEVNMGQGLSGGVGISFVGKYIVEYTFAPYGDFGNLSWISLGVKFGKARGMSKEKITAKKEQTLPRLIPEGNIKKTEYEILPVPEPPASKSSAEKPAAIPKKSEPTPIRRQLTPSEKGTLDVANTNLDELMRKYQNGEISWGELMKISRQIGASQ